MITFRQQLEIRYHSAVRQGFVHTACALKEIMATVLVELDFYEKQTVDFTRAVELWDPGGHDTALLRSTLD